MRRTMPSLLRGLIARAKGRARAKAMRLRFSSAACSTALATAFVVHAERLTPTVDFNDMRVIVRYLSVDELLILHAEYGAHIDRRELRQDYRHGFSILVKNRETGALTCQIYLANAQRPRTVDDEATLVLGHELLHCMQGRYHR